MNEWWDRYHGTGTDFAAFDTSKFGKATGSEMKAISLAENPDLAHPFANLAVKPDIDLSPGPTKSMIDPRGITSQVRTWADGTPMVIDDNPWTGKVWHPDLPMEALDRVGPASNAVSDKISHSSRLGIVDSTSGKPTLYGARILPLKVAARPARMLHISDSLGNNFEPVWYAAEQAFSRGLPDGRKLNLIDVTNYNSVAGFPQETISYVQDPKNIRSKFAAFDPKRREEADLLAGLVPGGLMSAASTDDDEAHSTRLHVTP
ncbi:hypothetical protein [Desulfolutivibrio sulfoxidireducens]|uniref:hypothetical protein n=1 Tax=Desulfolutivibrio sulfoxidireducens TaxID=2773299 RepID=UPI00159D1C09|nr:hypothetical protein [Desulfolutivibrio sulfoxidireducens]QLA16242.1 hypothetical protein GD605_08970 [Desulfolutivibrio sulfoxidireducens]